VEQHTSGLIMAELKLFVLCGVFFKRFSNVLGTNHLRTLFTRQA